VKRIIGALLFASFSLITMGCGGSPASRLLSQTSSNGSTTNTATNAATATTATSGSSTPSVATPTNLVPQSSAPMTLAATTTVAAETANNTSTAASFAGTTNGNIKGGNVSKVSVHSLLYPGHSTKIFGHYMPWWGSAGHINIGLNETDPAVVASQVADAKSRGFDGFMIDWYGPGNTSLDTATKNVKAAAETTTDFEFAIVEDSGSLNGASDVTSKLLSDIQYMNDTYFSSPRYLRWNNRPVVAFFLNTSLPINWSTVRAQAAGNPIFVFRDNGGFTTADSDGSFSWVGITGTPSNMGLSYVDSFYQTALAHSSQVAVGTAYKGFNDTIASWGANRIVDQQCGQTWLSTFNQANTYYSASNQLDLMQLPTWNDYEEGTEIETGIENCVSVSAAISGQMLKWTLGGQESTVDHYVIYVSADGQNLMPIEEQPTGNYNLDLSSYNLASGTYTAFVQAIGKPGLLNHMSGPVTFTR
jgi:hypothetical protein